MGDRANIKLTNSNLKAPLWLYSHSDGSRLQNWVRHALEISRERWDDPDYFNRAFIGRIHQMHGVSGVDAYRGMGISNHMGDNDGYPVIHVDAKAQTVTARNGVTYTFDAFVRRTDGDCEKGANE